jgi:hypothetical protein
LAVIQLAMVSIRAVVSSWSCGQSGPVHLGGDEEEDHADPAEVRRTGAVRAGARRRVRCDAVDEHLRLRHRVDLDLAGLQPVGPVRQVGLGVDGAPTGQPQHVARLRRVPRQEHRNDPEDGPVQTSSATSWGRALHDLDRLAVLAVTRAGRAVDHDVDLVARRPVDPVPAPSWAQWPAVMTHDGAISAPEHALEYCDPSGRVISGIDSEAAKAYRLSGTPARRHRVRGRGQPHGESGDGRRPRPRSPAPGCGGVDCCVVY